MQVCRVRKKTDFSFKIGNCKTLFDNYVLNIMSYAIAYYKNRRGEENEEKQDK